MSKKIVHIIIGLNIGGAELMLKRLILHSQLKGQFYHEVISLTDLGTVGKDLKELGINVYTLNMKSILSLFSIFFSLRKLLKNIKPDIVQTWMYHADFIGGIAAKSLGIKKIIWGIRTTDVTQGSSRLTIFLRRICAKLSYLIPTDIICAAHISKEVHINVGYDASKIHVIPNGFELNKLVVTEEDRRRIRKEFNIPLDSIVIGSVGRFNVVKNQKLFIEIANKLIINHPNLIFMLVGRDNTLHNIDLIKWLKDKNLTNNFRLLGQRKDIPACLKAMDIFCLHSRTEGFPNVLGEAMAVGTLSVSLDVGDSKYLLNNDNYIAKDKFRMVEIIEDLILNKEIHLDSIVENQQRILKYFSINEVICLFENIY